MKPRSKGDLPVPYIVALIIAIIVIAVLIYWFFVESNTSTNTGTALLCKGKLLAYCTQWATCNYLDCQPKDNTGNPADFYLLYTDCQTLKGKTDTTGYLWPSSASRSVCMATLGQGTASSSSPSP